jgi:hypothetical protein
LREKKRRRRAVASSFARPVHVATMSESAAMKAVYRSVEIVRKMLKLSRGRVITDFQSDVEGACFHAVTSFAPKSPPQSNTRLIAVSSTFSENSLAFHATLSAGSRALSAKFI